MSFYNYPVELEAFEGDGFIEAEVRRLVGKWAVRTIVETGTYRGGTTRALAGMGAQDVVTIEIDPCWKIVDSSVLSRRPARVRQLILDSCELGSVIPLLEGPFLFYLDAHWKEHSPLLEELEAISKVAGPAIIAIHDFFNPEHPEYGFDTWDIGPYRLELIEPALEKIYGVGGFSHWYNGEAAGLKRGIIYIEPK